MIARTFTGFILKFCQLNKSELNVSKSTFVRLLVNNFANDFYQCSTDNAIA